MEWRKMKPPELLANQQFRRLLTCISCARGELNPKNPQSGSKDGAKNVEISMNIG